MKIFKKLLRLFQQDYYARLITTFFELTPSITGLLFVRKYKTGIFFFPVISVPFYLTYKLASGNQPQYSSIRSLLFFYIPLLLILFFLQELFYAKNQ
jgi:hypothetical protein